MDACSPFASPYEDLLGDPNVTEIFPSEMEAGEGRWFDVFGIGVSLNDEAGFCDKRTNIEAIMKAHYDLERAFEILLEKS